MDILKSTNALLCNPSPAGGISYHALHALVDPGFFLHIKTPPNGGVLDSHPSFYFLDSSATACAAAKRAIGTRYGEQET